MRREQYSATSLPVCVCVVCVVCVCACACACVRVRVCVCVHMYIYTEHIVHNYYSINMYIQCMYLKLVNTMYPLASELHMYMYL